MKPCVRVVGAGGLRGRWPPAGLAGTLPTLWAAG